MALASYRASIGVQVDTALPADINYVNPHFAGTGDLPALNTLAGALATATKAFIQGTPQVSVKIYQDAAPKPNYPVAQSTISGTPLTVTGPREVALCLSYYATFNQPRRRGRLYLPWEWLNKHLGATAPLASRPSSAHRSAVTDFYTTVLVVLNTNPWDWVVRSDKNSDAYPVTNAYCDDEWDTQRRRGGKPTTRTAITIP